MGLNLNLRQKLCLVILFAFLANALGPVPLAQAQDFVLPEPGMIVYLSSPYKPPILKGIKVHPDNPFRFEFILDKGDSQLSNDQLKVESSNLIKYFLASLTIPEKDLWVNLSPYEKDHIIPNHFGLTEMGRDLLAEDYMLKQITASMIYPEDEVGKKFWKRIYEVAAQRFGTTNIPVNTFNKVWIVPEKAVVYENAKAGTAYVVESKLKVMLEQDYLSLQKHAGIQSKQRQIKDTNQLGSQIVREIVIPELTKEVNEDKNFSQLRQVYNSLILATWYKKKIKDSILEQVYGDKNKVAGVNIDDPQEKERIYQRYLEAFKKGVYNYIKEDEDTLTHQVVPRKYFSGGVELLLGKTNLNAEPAMTVKPMPNGWGSTENKRTLARVAVRLALFSGKMSNAAMSSDVQEILSQELRYDVFRKRTTQLRLPADELLNQMILRYFMDGKVEEDSALNPIWTAIKGRLWTGNLSPNEAFNTLRQELREKFNALKTIPEERFHLAVATTLMVQRAIELWSKPYNEKLNSMVDALNGDGWNCRAISYLTTLVVTELGFEGISAVDVLELHDGRILTKGDEIPKHAANLVQQGTLMATPDQGYLVNHGKIRVIEADERKVYPFNEIPPGVEGLTVPRLRIFMEVSRKIAEWKVQYGQIIVNEKNSQQLQELLDKGKVLMQAPPFAQMDNEIELKQMTTHVEIELLLLKANNASAKASEAFEKQAYGETERALKEAENDFEECIRFSREAIASLRLFPAHREDFITILESRVSEANRNLEDVKRFVAVLQRVLNRGTNRNTLLESLIYRQWLQTPDSRFFIYDQPGAGRTLGVNVQIANDAYANGLTDETVQHIIKIASHQDLTGTMLSGRSFIFQLPKGLEMHRHGRVLADIRIKAVTYEGGLPVMQPYSDENNIIKQPRYFYSVDRENRIRLIPSEQKPQGTEFLPAIINEYNVMRKAFDLGNQTSYPIGTGVFTDPQMVFNGKIVGFVIIAQQKTQGQSMGKRFLDGLQSLKNSRQPGKAREFMQDFLKDLEEEAKVLRQLHSTGITHAQPHVENFIRASDGMMILYDFAGAKSLETMSGKEEFVARMFFDFEALYLNTIRLTTHGLNGPLLKAFFQLMGLPENPFYSVAESYFTKQDIELIGHGDIQRGRKRLREAVDINKIVGFFNEYLKFSFVDGKTLHTIGESTQFDMIRIFEEIGGLEYERLATNPAMKSEILESGKRDNSQLGTAEMEHLKKFLTDELGVGPEDGRTLEVLDLGSSDGVFLDRIKGRLGKLGYRVNVTGVEVNTLRARRAGKAGRQVTEAVIDVDGKLLKRSLTDLDYIEGAFPENHYDLVFANAPNLGNDQDYQRWIKAVLLYVRKKDFEGRKGIGIIRLHARPLGFEDIFKSKVKVIAANRKREMDALHTALHNNPDALFQELTEETDPYFPSGDAPLRPAILLVPASSGFKRDYVDSTLRQNHTRLDLAMTQPKRGGIDLGAANKILQTRAEGGEIKFHMDPAMFQRLKNAPGFLPVIISIRPMTDLKVFLGMPGP